MDIREQMKEKIEWLNHHTALYNAGIPEVSDKEWDDVYFELANLENEAGFSLIGSPTQSISYEVVNSLKKVEHNHPMLSLDKTKDWNEFIRYFNDKDVVGMLKLDGLTCSLRYMNGRLVSAETRGNGVVGEDILHNAKVIPSIPNHIIYSEELILDGEVICTEEDFKPFSETYANSRNFASGSIRLLDSKECAERHLTFVVWNVIKGFDEVDSFCVKLAAVESLGFKVVPWTGSFDWDAKEFLVTEAKKLGYPIDGLVGRFDDISYGNSLGQTNHHSRAAYAFKFYDEEYETHLLNIEWTMGRTGILTPVAVFEPIDDGVSIIERANLHNISVMEDTLYIPYKGETIWVYKANQIIPQISNKNWVANEYDPMVNMFTPPEICPICGDCTAIVKSETGVKNLVCENPNCEGKIINKLDHYCGKKGMDIKGLSKATLEKLIDWGFIGSVVDLYHLAEIKDEWIKKPGFGVASVNKIINVIEASRKNELHKFISALGIPLVGASVSKLICKYINDWDDFISKVESHWDFTQIGTIGDAIQSSLYNYDYSIAKELAQELQLTNESENGGARVKNLEGMTFVVTGKIKMWKNRDELSEEIVRLGGKVASAVSSKTSYLIANAPEDTTKYKKAESLNIPIISEVGLIELIKENSIYG